MARDTYATCTALVRAIADDRDQSGGLVFADTELLPFINSAQREVHRELAVASASFAKAYTTRTLAGTDTQLDFDVPVGQVLPDDFVVPLRVWEKASGDPDTNYREMDPTEEMIPDEPTSERLRYWAWIGNGIRFLGATRTNIVRILYEKQLPALTAPTDKLPIPNSVDALAWKAIEFAAISRGESKFAVLAAGEFTKQMERLKRLHVKASQRRPRRRVPYSMVNSRFS